MAGQKHGPVAHAAQPCMTVQPHQRAGHCHPALGLHTLALNWGLSRCCGQRGPARTATPTCRTPPTWPARLWRTTGSPPAACCSSCPPSPPARALRPGCACCACPVCMRMGMGASATTLLCQLGSPAGDSPLLAVCWGAADCAGKPCLGSSASRRCCRTQRSAGGVQVSIEDIDSDALVRNTAFSNKAYRPGPTAVQRTRLAAFDLVTKAYNDNLVGPGACWGGPAVLHCAVSMLTRRGCLGDLLACTARRAPLPVLAQLASLV